MPFRPITRAFSLAVRFTLNPASYYCLLWSSSPRSQFSHKAVWILFACFPAVKPCVCKRQNANLGCSDPVLPLRSDCFYQILNSWSMYTQMETGLCPVWAFSLVRSIPCMLAQRAAHIACLWRLHLWWTRLWCGGVMAGYIVCWRQVNAVHLSSGFIHSFIEIRLSCKQECFAVGCSRRSRLVELTFGVHNYIPAAGSGSA